MMSGHNDCLIRLWDLEGSTGRVTATLAGHKGWVWCLCAVGEYTSPTVMVSGATDSKVLWWDRCVSCRCSSELPKMARGATLADDAQVPTCRRAGHRPQLSMTVEGETELAGPISGLGVRPDQTLVACNSFDGMTRFLDPRMGLRVRELTPSPSLARNWAEWTLPRLGCRWLGPGWRTMLRGPPGWT